MTACDDKALILNALVDGELDAANTVAIERHLETCPACAASLEQLQGLRVMLRTPDLSYVAPETFRRRLRIALDQAAGPSTRLRGRAFPKPFWWTWIASGGVVAAAFVGLIFTGLQTAQAPLTDQLVSDHVRALLADHLTDIPTSDRHVVKPWFNGKIAFAPSVIDLKEKGFPLVGGRLDLLEDQPVAALVYRRDRHVIDVFVRPQRAGDRLALDRTQKGYHLSHWSKGGLTYWAVSDLEPAQLLAFRALYVAALDR